MTNPAHTNRLAAETSPYLLQHAHNPVDWHAWGAEAFQIARSEDKPIFLSVGYSTCYWCHVMERQSFENEAIAAQMNKGFVCIKVDREERPDVDQLYMTAVQVLTRQGGWPMSVFLTPDLRPFYGGTYFPPQDAYGRPGFPRILAAIEDAWRNRRDEANRSADQLVGILRQLAQPQAPEAALTIDGAWIARVIRRCIADFDSVHGGFGSAPKFPRQTLLELLLVYLRDHGDDELMNKVRATLDAMANGGIRDHLGGGFHRYSTDEMWLVPHFEIMLYDNAMLLWIYAEAFRQTKDERYEAVAAGIADFVLREMTSPFGAFYTALDAEVDAQEGGSYLWTQEEVEEALKSSATAEQIARFCRVYGLAAGPNFADPHQGHAAPDKNVLYLAEPGEGAKAALLDGELGKLRDVLYAVRRGRKQPMLDTKILTSWNALMIRGLAHAGRILKEPRYIQAASAAADYLLSHHRDAAGGLLRVGTARFPAFLDDYAFLIQALLALEEAGDIVNRRQRAQDLAMVMRDRFGDSQAGGFFYTEEGAADLIVRQKVGSDSPLPSGNGIAALAMLAVDQPAIAAQTIGAFAGQLENVGEGMSALLEASLEYVRRHGPLEIAAGAVDMADRPLSPQELANRVVSVRTKWVQPDRLEIHCTVLAGFHIVADRLSIGFGDLGVVIERPAAAVRTLAFDEQPVALYDGEFVVPVRFVEVFKGKKVEFSLSYQACDDSACLPQTTRRCEATVP